MKKCEVVDVISRNNSNALSFFLSFPQRNEKTKTFSTQAVAVDIYY